MKKKVFDIKKYTHDQIVDSLLSPLNRWATKQAHNWCSDEDLYRNPHWLMENFINQGGATDFAKRHRAEYEREIEVPDEDYQI